MSYNSFLDAYFSSQWFGYGIPVLLMIILIVFGKKIYRRKEYTLWMRAINIGIPFLLIMVSALVNPIYWGYGRPVAIDDIRIANGKLFILDHIMTAGSRYDSGDPCSRIHILDPETGEKKVRFPVGYDGDFIGVHGDSLGISRYNDVAYFSIENGHLFTLYNRETLPKLFSQLSSGVDNFGWGDGRNIMEVTSLDGNNWNIYTQTGKIFPANVDVDVPKKKHVPSNKLYLHDNSIMVDDQPINSELLEVEGKNGNQYQKYICNNRDSILNDKLVFLCGQTVGINQKDSTFFILHYETLKKEKFILTCVSLDGKRKLWEIKQSTFNPTYIYHDYYSPRVNTDEHRGKLFFSIDKEVFAINMKDGQLLWRTKL